MDRIIDRLNNVKGLIEETLDRAFIALDQLNSAIEFVEKLKEMNNEVKKNKTKKGEKKNGKERRDKKRNRKNRGRG